ncbi:hypothetical protein ACN9MZ_17260 [Pseudoduganella sp. S-14]|jgi:hypothetical protein
MLQTMNSFPAKSTLTLRLSPQKTRALQHLASLSQVDGRSHREAETGK